MSHRGRRLFTQVVYTVAMWATITSIHQAYVCPHTGECDDNLDVNRVKNALQCKHAAEVRCLLKCILFRFWILLQNDTLRVSPSLWPFCTTATYHGLSRRRNVWQSVTITARKMTNMSFVFLRNESHLWVAEEASRNACYSKHLRHCLYMTLAWKVTH